MSALPLILTNAEDPTMRILTLNRPEKRNALSIALMGQLEQAIHDAGADARCRSILLAGNGPVFCAGLDLIEAAEPAHSQRSSRALAGVYAALCASPLVTIAAAQGAAMGGGVGLLAACDLVVAAGDLRIGFPEVRRGLVAALVTALLSRQLPQRKLRELVLLGQTIAAADALALGLVNRVVVGERMLEEARDMAAQVALGAPRAIERTKRLLDDLSARPIADNLARALAHHLDARNSAEAAEGIAAFRERREPRWPLPGDRP